MPAGAPQAAAAARLAAVVFVGGSSRVWRCMSGRDGRLCDTAASVSEAEGLDRTSLRLPGAQVGEGGEGTHGTCCQASRAAAVLFSRALPPAPQEELVAAVARAGVPVVVVVVHGGPLAVERLLEMEGLAALLSAPFGGSAAAAAIADVLLGEPGAAPAGRLPASWPYESSLALSDMTDMAMRPWPGRTYRYAQLPPVFPFGFGLSYTTWCGAARARAPHVPLSLRRACSRMGSCSADRGFLAARPALQGVLGGGGAALRPAAAPAAAAARAVPPVSAHWGGPALPRSQ